MASPRFSFSGWNSFSIAPKVNPASVPIQTPGLLPPAAPGQPVAQTSAANTNLPAWLQQEVDRINAQQALRTQLAGQVTGGGGQSLDLGGLLTGIANVTQAQTANQALQQQRGIENVIGTTQQQRSNILGLGSPGLYDLSGASMLDRRLRDFTTRAAPQSTFLASSFGNRPSGWISPMGGFF